jgi:hypothetical protein
MEAIYSPETSVDTQRNTRRYIPEDDTLHNHHRENFKSYIILIFVLKSFLKCGFTYMFKIIDLISSRQWVSGWGYSRMWRRWTFRRYLNVCTGSHPRRLPSSLVINVVSSERETTCHNHKQELRSYSCKTNKRKWLCDEKRNYSPKRTRCHATTSFFCWKFQRSQSFARLYVCSVLWRDRIA